MRGFAEKGVTLDLEEKEPGIGCAAASARNGSGAIVAAISISATNPYMPTDGSRALYVTREGAVSARHLKENSATPEYFHTTHETGSR
jgi:DNA-binding IclR family transcriptional regulator